VRIKQADFIKYFQDIVMSEEELEGEGFVIKDKRSSQLSEEDAESREKEEAAAPAEAPPQQEQAPFQIDFATFVMSLSQSAFYQLGEVPDPLTGQTETNLPAVHQTIDMLVMLKEKTNGNLTPEESKLLEQMIYELQMKYVAKSKQQP
jgi:hypothetical protein